MSSFMSRIHSLYVAAIYAVVALFAITAAAPAQSRKSDLGGSWNGVGTVMLPSGDSQQVRCRVRFNRYSSESYNMHAVCATPSGRAVQTAVIRRVGSNKYSGSFHNAEYNYSGSIFITLRGSRLSASLDGGGASGYMRLSR
ncbi:conserved exported protein of unknown function [Candidatus Filomicrobium marinum]|uniref:Uncharacterized protein n=3 Tax=Hyphomicrobiaceae TaxID=45401 RepID=A0A0D6J9D6_9HYPH|nr:conserved exported protein of unknown function [Candidatus Filomicrobium marinum]CPR14810.1 conserved exported protein of unknown function [Candidatus Filomicrobium marinum]SDO75118.1 hypothetical protein SAMN04488061_1561 [Filomicrobium insigne]